MGNKTNILINEVFDVLTTQVPNAKEISSFHFDKDSTITFSVNTLRLNKPKDFNKILNTIRYCGLTNIVRIGYSDNTSILLNITIDVSNLNVYYEYN